MSQPVFGRQPSRPLPRDGDSEPTEEFDIDLTDDTPEAERPDPEPESEPAEHDDEGAEAAEPAALDVEGAEAEADEPAALDAEEADEPAALDVEDESESDEPAPEPQAEPAALDVEESGGEPVVIDVEELAPAEPATQPAELVVADAEAVSAEPRRANGDDGAWVEIQAQFVDDPPAATAEALRMLRERLDGLVPAGASTEDLRVAFRRYRAAWFDLAEK